MRAVKRCWVAAGLVIAAGAVLWTASYLNRAAISVGQTVRSSHSLQPDGDSRVQALQPAKGFPASSTGQAEPDVNHIVEVEADSWIPDPLAVASIREGLAKGDPRVPPIKRAEPDERPDASELAMPDAYQGYESRQEQKLKAAFVVAVDMEIPALEAALEQARTRGLAPDQLREGEEKLRRMRQMQAQLLSDDAALQTLVDSAARE